MPGASPIRDALRAGVLRNVVVAFGALTLGEWILGTAAALAAFPRGGALAIGLVGARFIPAALASVLVAGLVAGVRAPRLLAAVGVLRAGCALGVALVLAGDGPVAALVALVWLDAAIGAAYRPAQARLLPSLSSTPLELTAVSALTSTAKSIGQVGGALLAGLLVAGPGEVTAAGVALACYLVTGLLSARLPAAARGSAPRTLGRLSLRRTQLGLRNLAADSGASRIAAWACARSALRGVWTSLGVIASLTILGMGPAGYGLLMTAAGAGTAAGLLLTSQLVIRSRLAGAFAFSLATAAAAIAAIGALPYAGVAVAVMLAWGAGMALADVTAQALLARVVAPSRSAQVVGTMEAGKLSAEGIGALVAPVAAHLIGLRPTLAGSAVLLLAALAVSRRSLRRIDATAAERTAVLELARGVPLFRALRLDGLEAVVTPMQRRRVPAGDVLVAQDTYGSEWYLVEHGTFEIQIDGFGVGRAGPGDSFGERGLMRDEPRAATVRALTDASVLALDRGDFLRAVTGSDDEDLVEGPRTFDPAEALRHVHLLRNLAPTELARLEELATTEQAAAGELLFAQDVVDDRFLLLLEGRVTITIDGVARRDLRPGDDFGSIAVLHGVPRTATATATEAVTLLVLPGAALRAVLPYSAAT